MSWTRVLATGWGKLEYRLQITGIEYEFVTNQAMVRDIEDSSGSGPGGKIKRRNGLLRAGLQVAEEVLLPENRIELAGNSFTIVDIDDNATRAFYDRATKKARLAFDYFGPDARTIGLDGGRNWKDGEYLWIGSEVIRLIGDPRRTTTGNWIFTCQRGKLGTIAQYHYASTNFGEKIYPWIQNAAFGLERQRVKLFAYGDGDDLQGEGTCIWRGVVSSEAMFDGMNWILEAGPITNLLKTEIGSDQDDIKFRGIYHSNRPFTVRFRRSQSNGLLEAVTPEIRASVEGFFENKWELAAALDEQLFEESTSKWSDTGTVVGCQIIDGELVFIYRNEGGDPRWVYGETLDGIREIRQYTGDRDQPIIPEETIQWDNVRVVYNWATGRRLEGTETPFEVEAGRSYAIRMKAGPFPDILCGYIPTRFIGPPSDPFLDPRRLYLDIDQINREINKVMVYGPAAEDSEDDKDVKLSEYAPYPTSGEDVDLTPEPTDRSLRVDLNFAFLARNEDTYIVLGNELVSQGTVVDFLEALIDQSPELANQGFGPLLHPDDFDIDDMRVVLDTLPSNSFTQNRKFVFFKKGKTIEEILAAEYKLWGVYPTLTADGKMTIRPMRQITANENATHILDANDILTDETYPTIVANKYGIYNSVTLKSLYDPVEDEHKGPTFTSINPDSIAANGGKKKTIEIEPISYFTGQLDLYYEDIVENFLIRQTGIMAYRYHVITIEVPMTMFTAQLGDTIRITNRQIPNPYNSNDDGNRRRGTSRLGGFITKKSFQLDQGFGVIEFLASPEDIVGELSVAPLAIALSAPAAEASLASDIVTVNLEDLGLAPGDSLTQHWSLGDAVVFDRFDVSNQIAESSGIGKINTITETAGGATIDVQVQDPGAVPANLLDGSAKYLLCPAPITLIDAEDTGVNFRGSTKQRSYTHIDGGTKDSGFDIAKMLFGGGFSI